VRLEGKKYPTCVTNHGPVHTLPYGIQNFTPSFTLFKRVLFTFPSQYFYSIGLPRAIQADYDFQVNRPAVSMNKHLFWYLMCRYLSALSRRKVQSSSPVLLTKKSPLGALAFCPLVQLRIQAVLTNLKFDNRSRNFVPRVLYSFALPDKTACIFAPAILRETSASHGAPLRPASAAKSI